jgi:hypothetical protein
VTMLTSIQPVTGKGWVSSTVIPTPAGISVPETLTAVPVRLVREKSTGGKAAYWSVRRPLERTKAPVGSSRMFAIAAATPPTSSESERPRASSSWDKVYVRSCRVGRAGGV